METFLDKTRCCESNERLFVLSYFGAGCIWNISQISRFRKRDFFSSLHAFSGFFFFNISDLIFLKFDAVYLELLPGITPNNAEFWLSFAWKNLYEKLICFLQLISGTKQINPQLHPNHKTDCFKHQVNYLL